MTDHPRTPQPNFVVTLGVAELTERAAQIFVEKARNAVASRGMFSVALSGGRTPRPLYEKLAGEPFRNQIDWSLTQVFFSDERFVPPDSSESNFRMARDSLLSNVPIPERFVHPVATVDLEPEEAASNYEEGIRRVLATGLDEVPRFDLVLLGLGPDGHTASLFPGTEALSVSDRLVVANFVQQKGDWRITFTYPLIDAARTVLFLVSGTDKADALDRVLSGDQGVPAANVHPHDGQLLWIVDETAAAGLGESERRGRFSRVPGQET